MLGVHTASVSCGTGTEVVLLREFPWALPHCIFWWRVREVKAASNSINELLAAWLTVIPEPRINKNELDVYV
jgi:hypothetical protein